jgi:hypothetical protein
MCASGYSPPPRDVALRREAFLEDSGADVAGFLARMASGGFSGILKAYAQETDVDSAFADRNARHLAASSAAEAVDGDEAGWLARRIGRDGRLHENEKALLAFLKRESPDIHPDLKPLLDKVA